MAHTDDYSGLRSAFKEQFYAVASNNNVNVCNEWEAPLPDFEPVLIKLFDTKTSRILTVRESSEDSPTDCVDFFIKKTGVYFEQVELSLVYKDALDNISFIFEIYKKWFIEKTPEKKMGSMLAKQRAELGRIR